jgi:rSAM/selenodomain-associated transferase 1
MTLHSGAMPATVCAMAVMGKASIPGRAKTRLVPPLRPEEAARLNTAFLQDALGNVIAAAGRPYVAFGPRGSEAFFRENLPAEVGLIEACLPNFGDCLHLAIETMLGAGHRGACVINSDSPTLPTRLLRAAARMLAEPGDRVVLGPSEDGGYYLLGLKSARRTLFEDIDWSTDRVAVQTRQRAAAAGLPLLQLDPWYDVDDLAALQRLRAELADGPGDAADRYPAPATRRALAQLLADDGVHRRLNATTPSPGADAGAHAADPHAADAADAHAAGAAGAADAIAVPRARDAAAVS